MDPSKSLLNTDSGLRKTYSQTCQKEYNENSGYSFEQRLENAEDFCEHETYEKRLPITRVTVSLILEQSGIPKKNLSFNIDEQILCLELYVSLSESYSLLSAIFSLPSENCLFNLLEKVDYKAGVNKKVFKKLNKILKEKTPREKICVLILEEFKLGKSLHYNEHLDQIVGYEDFGDLRSGEFADHASLIMLQSLYQQEKIIWLPSPEPWHQPVYYGFSKGPMKSETTVKVIEQILSECFKCRIQVVAIVCGGSSNEVEAINSLLEKTRKIETLPTNFNLGSICFQGKEIVLLYDISNLFMEIRDNFLKYNIHYVNDQGQEQVGKWQDIIQLYEFEKSSEYPSAQLTKEMVYENIMDKSKISDAVKVFHEHTGAILARTAGVVSTGMLLHTFGMVYESLNSRSPRVIDNIPVTAAVNRHSRHLLLWDKSLKILTSIKLFCPVKNDFIETPNAIKNLILTLQGFKRLRIMLLFKKNFPFIATRLLNKTIVRTHFSCTENPLKFSQMLKSYVLTKPICNCQENYFDCPDDDKYQEEMFILSHLLTTLPELISQKTPRESFCQQSIICSSILPSSELLITTDYNEFTEYCFKTMLKLIDENCLTCQKNLQSVVASNDTPQITNSFKSIICESLDYLLKEMPQVCSHVELKAYLVSNLSATVNFRSLKCNLHENFVDMLCNLICETFILINVSHINRNFNRGDNK